MTTYLNGTDKQYWVTNTKGEKVLVAPGEKVDTDFAVPRGFNEEKKKTSKKTGDKE